jgi:phage FluMu gp28-like protein
MSWSTDRKIFNSEKWYEEQIAKQKKIAEIDEMKIRLENEQKQDSELIEKINSIKKEIKRVKAERKLKFGY